MGQVNQNISPSERGTKGEDVWYNSLATSIADFLTSLALLLLAFAGFMAYRYYEVQQIFDAVLDDTWPSHVIAVVAIFTTLIFMVNSSHLSPFPIKDDEGKVLWHFHWSKLVLVIYAFVINYFFWKPWEGENIYDIVMRWFCCVMFSSMDYGFAHLFKEKQAMTTAQQDLTNLDQQLTNKEEELTSKQQELTKTQQEINQTKEKKKELDALIDQFTCKHCGVVKWPEKSITSHQSKCPKNPDKQKQS